jgi:hypothetical protein
VGLLSQSIKRLKLESTFLVQGFHFSKIKPFGARPQPYAVWDEYRFYAETWTKVRTDILPVITLLQQIFRLLSLLYLLLAILSSGIICIETN